MFGFEKLDVWVKAVDFADEVYRVTKTFPADERYGLTNQLRRASVSISANIAEGSGRQSNPDFSRFLRIAYGSLMECVSELHIANRQAFVTNEELDGLRQRAEEISKMLSGLMRSLNRDKD